MNSNDRLDIYNKGRYTIERDFSKIQLNQNITPRNKILLTNFLTHKLSDGTSPQRCKKIATHLRIITENFDKDLDAILKDELLTLVLKYKTYEGKSESTRQDYVLALKQFYKWFEDEDERLYSEDVMVRRKVMQLYKFIKNSRLKTHRKKVNPADIITEDDMREIINYTDSVRDKAFVKVLHETGARAGEFLNIKLKHITITNEGKGHIHLDGKTGERRVPILFSIPYLKQYIACHPFKDDPNTFLWWTNPKCNNFKPLKHRGGSKLLQSLWERIPTSSPIKRKSHNMHFFRHSRASLLAPTMSESLLCKYMGWTLSSKQAKTYVHLSPEDLDNAFYGNFGMTSKESNEKQLIPRECEICGTVNDSKAEFCLKCGRPMSLEVSLMTEDLKKKETAKTFQAMMKMMQDKEFVEFAKKEGFSF